MKNKIILFFVITISMTIFPVDRQELQRYQQQQQHQRENLNRFMVRLITKSLWVPILVCFFKSN